MCDEEDAGDCRGQEPTHGIESPVPSRPPADVSRKSARHNPSRANSGIKRATLESTHSMTPERIRRPIMATHVPIAERAAVLDGRSSAYKALAMLKAYSDHSGTCV